MYDYHVHSHFSSDCEIDMEEMIKKGIAIGLKEICFTDHIDYAYQDPSITFEFDPSLYTQALNQLSKKYQDKIKVLKGIEIGIQPHIIEKCNTLVENHELDFVISSIHTANKQDIHIGDFFSEKTPHEAYRKYFEELLLCTEKFKNFNVLGHMNLLKRYHNHAPVQNIKNYFDIIEEIFKTLVYDGKGIEVNTSGFKYNLEETIPGKELLSFYKSLGGEVITIGSDAHHPDYLTYKFDYVYHLLKEIGFKYICVFENMKPSFIKI